jgi:hypothetical protein
MRFAIAAAFALAISSSLGAQDLSVAVPLGGSWNYTTIAGGSEASFTDAYTRPQLWLRCNRAARTVSISKPASAAAPSLNVWTSSQSKQVPASYDATTARLTIDLAATDALLDAIATSRGRFAVSITGQPALVLPPWGEVGRIVEDCRV